MSSSCMGWFRGNGSRKMQLHRLLGMVAGVAAFGFGLSASAAPITSFNATPVSDSNALTDDPNLANTVQNVMSVNVGNNDWTNSSIRITLTAGSVYNATNAVGTESNPVPAFWGTAGFRNGPYDTFVNS